MASTLVPCASCGVKNFSDRTACHQCGADLGTVTVSLHLAPLLLPTPSGVAKLLAAWDGLSTESQILILTKLKTMTRPEYLSERIRIKALDSANAYVRYLAASSLRTSGDDVLKHRIEQDPDALVRNSALEAPETAFVFGGSDKLKDADTFFALSHEARLAVVRSMVQGGKQLAEVITIAVDHKLKEGDVSEIELFEILCDYMKKPSFREYYDSWGDRHRSDYPLSELGDISALWNIVPKLSEAISYVLIENLPAKIARESAIPDEVPKQLNPRQVEKLLYRSDVGLENFRKEIFWASAPHDFTRFNAASSHNFNLDFLEFSRILDLSKKEKAEILMHLLSAEDLSPFLYEAISDAFLVCDENAGDYPWIGKYLHKLGRNLRRLRGWHGYEIPVGVDVAGTELSEDLDLNLRVLGLYRVAKKAVPWKEGGEWREGPPTGELEFLSKFVVQGDTWRTFMEFHKAWVREKPHEFTCFLEHVPEWPRRLQDPEEALSDRGREGNFLEDKIDFIGKRDSLEQKIDSIKTKLLFYEEKFETFCKDLRYILWTVIIVFAISYGWKFVAALF